MRVKKLLASNTRVFSLSRLEMRGVVPKTMKALQKIIKDGEGQTLEFKRSTGELKEGLQTICAFLNGSGGTVIFGVGPKGTIEGQQVSDKTLREITQTLDRFEPPVDLHPHCVSVGKGKEAILLCVDGNSDSIPFTYDGRAYERISSSTRKMPKDKYERLILERLHLKKRWENLPADGVTAKGAAVVTFYVNVLGPQAQAESPTQSTDPVERLLKVLAQGPLSPDSLKEALHLKHRPTFRANYLRPALERDLIEPTIPDKPTSSKQKYRLTDKGRKLLGGELK